MEKKWYLIGSFGDVEAWSAVELTDEENATLKRIFKQAFENTVVAPSWGEQSVLVAHGFDTKNEAKEYANLPYDEQIYEEIIMHSEVEL